MKRGGWLAVDHGNGMVYCAKGNRTADFYVYAPYHDTWADCAPIPAGPDDRLPDKGCRGVSDGSGAIYMTKGHNTLEFWRYVATQNAWERLPDVPQGPNGKRVKGGTDLVYVERDDTGYVYLLKGYKTEFYRYNATTRQWQALENVPWVLKEKWRDGSWLVYDADGGRYLYAHQGKYYDQSALEHHMFRYDLAADTWDTRPLSGMPLPGLHGGRIRNKKSKDGSAGAWAGGAIYALKGGNSQQFWKYSPPEDAWRELDTMPSCGSTGRRRRVKSGGDLASWGMGIFFALKGNRTRELWLYALQASRYPGTPWAGSMAERSSMTAIRMTVAPSPLTGGFATVRYSLPHAGPGIVRVLDITGREVLRRNLAPARTGALGLDIRHLSAGVYLVRLDAGGYSATSKLVVEK